MDDFERCYRAVQSKDARFDGWFFTAVTSTGIYCRPSCPAMAPKAVNCRFFPTAAAAQQAGFRACKRCRPDAAPGSPEWDARGDVVARAMRLIVDGLVDREGVGALASRVGYSTRQLERLLVRQAGAGPLALARAQRAQAARLLVETTALPMADVAFAAGFSSVRQFNATVNEVFALSPTQMRQRALPAPGARANGSGAGGRGRTVPPTRHALVVRLPFRRPFCPDNLFGHLAATAVPGVEEVRDGAYRRALDLAHGLGVVSLRPDGAWVWAALSLEDLRDLGQAVARCRRLLDLDADPRAVDDLLSQDPALAPLVQSRPGRRVPRCVDESEMALRVVLGQQVSTAAARAHAGRLASAYGRPVEDTGGGLWRTFPRPGELAAGLLTAAGGPGPHPLRMPAARRRAVQELAGALAEGKVVLGPGTDWEQARAQLCALPGVGAWTAELVAMRALGDPDAFPASDGGLLRAAAGAGLPTSPSALTARSGPWRPWRSYATQYLWATLDHPINRFESPGATGAQPKSPRQVRAMSPDEQNSCPHKQNGGAA